MRSFGPSLLCVCLSVNVWSTAIASEGEADRPLVTTKYGQLRGQRLGVKGTDRAVNAFYGIPFAKPPLGELRFSPPEPAEPWNNIKDATIYPPLCMQDLRAIDLFKKVAQAKIPDLKISEDCLYLNIYTPETRKNAKLPVMVWIHGGGLVMGGASMFDGSALSAYENVLIVAIQYRLGVLGYFSTGDEHARGNWGFLDQVVALKWVQENIEDFGGDPDSVTIFGESAGGISTAALVLSPLAEGLFHKAIAESGVALLPGILCTNQETVLFLNHKIANATGCETTDSAAIVSCMRKKTEEEILAPTETAMQFHNSPLEDIKGSVWEALCSYFCVRILTEEVEGWLFAPAVTDGVFFPKNPEDILAAKESNRVPFLIGINNHEYGHIIFTAMNISSENFQNGLDRETVNSYLQHFSEFMGSMAEFMPLVVEEYLGDTEDPIKIRDAYLDMLGDLVFVYPAIKTAKYHRDTGLPVYFYEFQHPPSMFAALRPSYVKADHADEVGFVLGGPFLDNDISFMDIATDEEKNLSKKVMKYWANFARNGDPNSVGLPEWPVYDAEERYLGMSLDLKIGKQLKEEKFTFFSKILPEKIEVIKAQKKEHTEL